MNKKFKNIIRLFGVLMAIILIGFIVFRNTAPTGANIFYNLESNGISKIGPPERVVFSDEGVKLKDNLVYLATDMPFDFDSVKVRVLFERPYNSQEILLGYKDNSNAWHYNNKVIFSSLLDDSNWKIIGDRPYLYQKNAKYDYLDQFFAAPPNSTVGFFEYQQSDFVDSNLVIPEYTPARKKITLNVPLRGTHTMYAYLDREQFELEVEKIDLNWYEDPDVMVIKVFKEDDLVLEQTINDDGISDDSKILGTKQVIELKNPGPELPESGIYKIIFELSLDSVISRITTNLSRLVFEGPIFPIYNEVYKDLITETKSLVLFTNSDYLTFKTYHNASLQTVQIDGEGLILSEINKVFIVNSLSNDLKKIELPTNDVSVNGSGFFSFSFDRFFAPLPFNALQIKNTEDLEQVNYILSSYKPTEKNGSMSYSETEFDLSSAVIENGKLSWLISAPGLKESNGEILIKQIEFSFIKNGWFGLK